MNVAYTIIDSPQGPIYAAEIHDGLIFVGIGSNAYRQMVAFARQWVPDPQIRPSVIDATQQLTQYLAGDRRIFDLPLVLYGTEFQKAVWRKLLDIPYGLTISYGRLAESIGRPKAARAVGRACGANPIPLVVPCHRVLASDGGLGGYGGGLEWKRWLLALEGARAVAGL